MNNQYQHPPSYGPPPGGPVYGGPAPVGYGQPPQQYGQPPAQQPPQQYAVPPGVNANMPVQSVSHTPVDSGVQHSTSITVGPFLLNFPKLFRPDVYTAKGETPDPDAVPKYSCELWLYRSSKDFDHVYGQLQAALNAVSLDKFKIPWDSPQFERRAIRDLAVKGGDIEPGIFIRPSSSQPPKPVVGNPPRLATEDEIYAGCYVYANLNPAAFTNKGKGLKWYLNGIWKTADGDRLTPERDPVAGFTHLLNVVQTQYRAEAPAGMQFPQANAQMPPAYPPQQQYGQQPPQQYPPQQYSQQPPMPGYDPRQLPY